MSTTEPSTQGMTVPKQIGKRVLEIMEELGRAYTQQALANRIGMSRPTLAMKLRGERDLYMFELRRIAETLHLTVERIMQEDSRDDEKALEFLFSCLEKPNHPENNESPNFDLILEIAEKLSSIAVGFTERCKTLNDLGRAYFLNQRYEDAYNTWLSALEFSRKIVSKYNDRQLYYLVLSNLLLASTVVEEYSDVDATLEEVETAFSADPFKLGVAFYVRAKRAERDKNIEAAKNFAYKSLECYISTGIPLSIGKAEKTVAHYEFLCGNYEKAKELLENAVNNLLPYKVNWLRTIIDYAKTLIKLQCFKHAEEIVRMALDAIKPGESRQLDVIGKLYVLLSACSGDIQYAESVLSDSKYEANIRVLSFKLLKKHCIRIGDENALMKYTVIEDKIGINPDDVMDEEVL